MNASSNAVSIIPDAAPSSVGFPAPLPLDPVDPTCEKLTPKSPSLHEGGEDVLGPPPDGGLDAWLCVLSAMFLPFCIFGFSEYPCAL